MATKTLNTRIIMRNDTAENWTTKNPTLSKGEFGVENDTNKFKIGDGATIESTDGVLSVKAVGISKVFVEDGVELVMNGGNA